MPHLPGERHTADQHPHVSQQTQYPELQPKPQGGEVDVLAAFFAFHGERLHGCRPGNRHAEAGDRVFADLAEHIGALVQPVAVLDVGFQLRGRERCDALGERQLRLEVDRPQQPDRRCHPKARGHEQAAPGRRCAKQQHQQQSERGADPEGAPIGEDQAGQQQRAAQQRPQRQLGARQHRRENAQQRDHDQPVGRRFVIAEARGAFDRCAAVTGHRDHPQPRLEDRKRDQPAQQQGHLVAVDVEIPYSRR